MSGTVAFDYGPCCACRREGGNVGNLMLLDVKTPEPGGTAWGCTVCGLASEGACAVLCDDCAAAGRDPVEIIAGYAAEKRRLPITRCTEPHRHDPAKHPERQGAAE